jgi:23S rRNA (cytosine1962-C5)-methyltransferase
VAIPELRLKIRVHGRHPWFFRKMIERPDPPIAAGSAVRVVDRERTPVGIGFYNPRTELALRMLARDPDAAPEPLLLARLAAAIELRDGLLELPRATDAYRLVHAEGDGISGLVLDRLGDAIVAQVSALAVMQRIEGIGEALLRWRPGAQLVLTADDEAVKREGFERPPRPRAAPVAIQEHGIRYEVVPGGGHKTGFFADQRDNRLLVGALARGRRVLDLCCNAGGFALHAARGGARRVLAVDLDEESVARTRANAARNAQRIDVRQADLFDLLRDAKPGEHDLIVLDPPKWVGGKAELEGGMRRYFDANRLLFEKLAPGGIAVTCSCSGAVSEERFVATLRSAAAAAGRDARILHRRGAGPDHPVALECPETSYLKCVVLQC